MLDTLIKIKRKKEKTLRTSWGGHNELIEGEALSSGSNDSSSGGLSESKSGNSQFWDFKKSHVISNSGNSHDSLVSSIEVLDDSGDGKRWSVHSGGDESSQDGSCEIRVRSSGQESEQSDEKMNIEVLAS